MDEPQLPSEADRLAEVFRDVDTWANSGSGMTAILNNYSIDKSYLGSNVSKEFNNVMFDSGHDKLPSRVDSTIALSSTFSLASDLYHRYKFLVNYLEAGKGINPVQTFIQEIRQDTIARPHWQISPSEEFKQVWYTLWNLLSFPADVEIRAQTFQEQIHMLFQTQRITALTSFSINLADLESVDLRVKPTPHIHEHLLIEGNTVNILKVTMDEIDVLRKYRNNRAAKALGIASLGEEIALSLNVLYARDEFFDRAEALGIYEPGESYNRTLSVVFLRDIHFNVQPKVLAHRAHVLQKLVKYRRSWWASLVRDMKKQLQTQPVLFYGAILAVFFGVCTVIQTVASVLSLFK